MASIRVKCLSATTRRGQSSEGAVYLHDAVLEVIAGEGVDVHAFVEGQEYDVEPVAGTLPFAAVIGASRTTPVVLTTARPHELRSGMTAIVAGVEGNLGANGTFVVTVVDPTHVSLESSIGSGDYTVGGSIRATAAADAPERAFGDRRGLFRGPGAGGPEPPRVTARAISATGIRLAMTAGVGAATHTLHRSTTAGFVPDASNKIMDYGAVPGLSFDDSGLTSATAYSYVLRALTADGHVDSVEATATTF